MPYPPAPQAIPYVSHAQGLEHPLVLADAEEVQCDEAISAFVDADAAEVLVTSTSTRPLHAIVEVIDQVVLAHVHDAFVHRPVNALALASALDLVERCERCCDQQVAVDVVAGVGHRDHRLLRRAVLAGEACIRADRAIVGGALHAIRVAIGAES